MPLNLFAALFALLASSAIFAANPAAAVDGVVLITQAKAEAGGVTPGDKRGFPVSISAPGSYRLATNLQVPASKDGIVVNATEVSIDLNGFRLNGGGGTTGTGIVGNQRSLTVRNGTIRAFKLDGIYVRGALSIVADMRISENGATGIRLAAANSVLGRILSSTIFGNGYQGISCDISCHVEGNIVASNGLNSDTPGGIVLSTGTVLGNTILSNGGYGITAYFVVGFGNNTIQGNTNGSVTGGVAQLFPNACSPEC